MIKKYQRKQTEIRAVQWNGKNTEAVRELLAAAERNLIAVTPRPNRLFPEAPYVLEVTVGAASSYGYRTAIEALEGDYFVHMQAPTWGRGWEVLPPDVFEKLFEEVEDDEKTH